METTDMTKTVAEVMQPMIDALLDGDPPVRLEFWDGSGLGSEDGPGTIRMNSPDALRRVVWAPDELGFSRAFVAGDIDVDGNVAQVLGALQRTSTADGKVAIAAAPRIVAATRQLGLLKGTPPSPPPEEIVPHGLRHSISRDKEAVSQRQ